MSLCFICHKPMHETGGIKHILISKGKYKTGEFCKSCGDGFPSGTKKIIEYANTMPVQPRAEREKIDKIRNILTMPIETVKSRKEFKEYGKKYFGE